MSHRSLQSNPLSLVHAEFPPTDATRQPDVWLFTLPFPRIGERADVSAPWVATLCQFLERLSGESVVCFLCPPEIAASLWPRVEALLRFQLWIAIKRDDSQAVPGQLPNKHAALLIGSRYARPLRHTKTRIAYTVCPACEKTTKDYGGKKHTYDDFGTLMSDVWRDVSWTPATPVDAITDRLRDLFGLEPHRTLRVVDWRDRVGPVDVRREDIGLSRPPEPTSDARVESRLIQGDCLQSLASLPTDSIDFCFADPPYNLDKKYESSGDNIDIREYFHWCDQWLNELARVLRPGRTCAVLNIPLWAIRHHQHLAATLRFQSWIVWEGLSLPVRMVMPAHYAIVCFSKGMPRSLPGLVGGKPSGREAASLKPLREFFCTRPSCVEHRRVARIDDAEPLSDVWWDIHRLKHNARRVDHPCQLPPALMRRLIALFTWEGEIVLDPFNGAGTTTLCAAQLERKHIGLELSEKYHQIAQRRHEELQDGLDPFRKVARTPLAKNSRVGRIGGIDYAVRKKTLQLDVRRIAGDLGRLPTRDEVRERSPYPIEYFDTYFISWGEVCAAARHTGMSESRRRHAAPGVAPTLFEDAR
jgi:DNA modification methylase